MSNDFVVNSFESLKAFEAKVSELFADKKFVRFRWSIGENRRLSQNALLHVWLTEYAAHLLNVERNQVSEQVLAGIKKEAKKRYYNETGNHWLVHYEVNPWSGKTKLQLKSSSSYTTGEMFDFLTWLQMQAANDGLILESKGDFASNQKKQSV